MIHTLSISLLDRDEALTLRTLIEELGYTVQLSSTEGTAQERTPCRDTRLGKIILRHFRANASRTFNEDDIAILCEEHDYKGRSASPTLYKLVTEGDLKRVATGTYQLNGEKS